mgnify:CR=1 FL=1
MCLGIPMQIEQIDGDLARCNANGIRRTVNLFLLEAGQVQVGDFVMVHVGYAIQKVSAQAARTAWDTQQAMWRSTPDA